jgi:hypothetical protein
MGQCADIVKANLENGEQVLLDVIRVTDCGGGVKLTPNARWAQLARDHIQIGVLLAKRAFDEVPSSSN